MKPSITFTYPLITILAVLTWVAPPIAARASQAFPFHLSARVVTGEDICIGEQVVMGVTVTNTTDHTVKLSTANDGNSFLYFGVYDSMGQLVGKPQPQSWPPRRYIDWMSGIQYIPPKAQHDFFFLLKPWHDFKKAGDYKIIVRFNASENTPLRAHPGTDLKLHVNEFSESHLRDKCRQLYEMCLPDSKVETDGQAYKAISAVRNPVVFPFLRELALRGSAYDVLLAIRRLDTPESKRFYQGLMKRKDSIGKNARYVAKMRLG